jgi:hypothetical protein
MHFLSRSATFALTLLAAAPAQAQAPGTPGMSAPGSAFVVTDGNWKVTGEAQFGTVGICEARTAQIPGFEILTGSGTGKFALTAIIAKTEVKEATAQVEIALDGKVLGMGPVSVSHSFLHVVLPSGDPALAGLQSFMARSRQLTLTVAGPNGENEKIGVDLANGAADAMRDLRKCIAEVKTKLGQ